MTANQINYARAVEERRHNREMEEQNLADLRERARANSINEANTRYANEETNRHNLVTERNVLLQTKETARSNQQRERETYRHNRSTEDLGVYELAEKRERRQLDTTVAERNLQLNRDRLDFDKMTTDWNQRHTILTREEAIRHNRETEAVNWANVGVARSNVGLGYANLQAEYQRIGESIRHNQAVEQETNRSNLANESIRDEANWVTGEWNLQNYDLKSKELNYKYPYGRYTETPGLFKSLAESANYIGSLFN